MARRSRCVYKDLKRHASSRNAERISGQCKIASRTIKVGEKPVVEDVDLVKVDTANEIVAAAADIRSISPYARRSGG